MEENAPQQTPSSSKTVPIIIAVVAILAIGGIGIAMTQKKTTTPTSSTDPGANQTEIPPTTKPTETGAMMKKDNAITESKSTKTFEVSAKNFSFTPSTIKVKQGDTVKIVFKNTEGLHNFIIDEYSVATKQIQDDSEETVEFVASKKGDFEYYCSVGNHRAMGMTGTLTVE